MILRMKGGAITNYIHHRFVIVQDSPRQLGHEVTALKGVSSHAPIPDLPNQISTGGTGHCSVSIPDESHWCEVVPESWLTTSESSEELIKILFWGGGLPPCAFTFGVSGLGLRILHF